METVPDGDLTALALIQTIRTGDIAGLQRLLLDHPHLASARIHGAGSRTPLHVATDWPGYFPNGPVIVGVLIDAGADPNGADANDPIEGGPHDETPLHWAASSDDVDVAAALIDAGADIEAPGSSIAGGSPLENAVGYGCWHVGRLLIEQGARVDRLWQAAALGIMPRVEELLAGSIPTAGEITEAFGRPAMAVSAGCQNTCWLMEQTSTGAPVIPTRRRWALPAPSTPAGTP